MFPMRAKKVKVWTSLGLRGHWDSGYDPMKETKLVPCPERRSEGQSEGWDKDSTGDIRESLGRRWAGWLPEDEVALEANQSHLIGVT